MIGVVVPAHNEEVEIGACLASLMAATSAPELLGEPVMVVVVLDDCSDDTGAIADGFGVATIAVQVRNVGIARSIGAAKCLEAGARWLAFTDADTVVSAAWLVAQLGQCSDVVCGTVGVKDWNGFHPGTRLHHESHYRDVDGHRHIHGANLGVSAPAYLKAGGFQPLETSEDVALVEALRVTGATIAWSAAPRVETSTRRQFRAPAGFGATLLRMDAEAMNAAGSGATQAPAC
jgi:glycosyltransferase involved in cell wall biosynthesis